MGIAESQPHVPKNCLKDRFRRLEDEDEEEFEDEDEEERELSDSAPVGSFNAVCQKRLTKANGSTKSGKRAVCTLCSACSNYNSGWCADNCDQYGKRVRVSNKNTINIPNGLRNCIAESQPHVPKNCLKDRFRRLEDEDEEERELSDSAPEDEDEEERELSDSAPV